MKKPTLRPGAAPDSDAPAKIQIATILDTADLTVGVEDVLAARVFRKALGAQATMLGLVAVGLLYLGWDARNTRSELKKSQAALDSAVALAQTRIAASEKQIVQQVDSAQGLVGSADHLVKSTNSLLTATGAYQAALATNLSSIGSNLTKTEELRRVVVDLDSSMRDEAKELATARAQLAQQRVNDAAEIDRLSDEITRAAPMYKNTFTQVVEEDAPTPVGASEFALTFDDLYDGDNLATRVTLTYRGSPIPGGWNDSRVRLNEPAEFEINGLRYRVRLMQGTTRRVWLVNRKQRLVISIIMLETPALPRSAAIRRASADTTTGPVSQ